MSARSSFDLELDPRSIVATRVFDAPRELVWTDPVQTLSRLGDYLASPPT